jgi:hypothetical protein
MPEAPATPDQTQATPIVNTTEIALKQRSQELGLFGKLFGSREHAPVNIAGAIVILGMLGLFIVAVSPSSPDFSKADLIKSLIGLVLAALTFLGGYLGASTK